MNRKSLAALLIVPVMSLCFPGVLHAQGNPEVGEKSRYDTLYPPNIVEIRSQFYIKEVDGILFRFRTVLFDMYSLTALSEAIKKRGGLADIDTMLDLGTGTGSLGIMALGSGAKKCVGTDLDPIAIMNVRYNIRRLGLENRFEARLVPLEKPGVFSVVKDNEKFDLILSDPPQNYGPTTETPTEEDIKKMLKPKHGFFAADIGFRFLKTLVEGLDGHLSKNGRAWLIMRVPEGKVMLKELADKNGFDVRVIYSGKKEFDPTGKYLPAGGAAHIKKIFDRIEIYEIERKK